MLHKLRAHKYLLFLLILTIAALAVMLPYRKVFQVHSAFAPYNYQTTLILDAGHGGADGGAVAEDGTAEQDINLVIVQKCKAFAGLFGIRTILTREDNSSVAYDPEQSIRANKVADIHAREQIAEQVENPIFLSVHLNKFSDAAYSGAQVFWSKNNPEGQILAQELQKSFTLGLSPARERQAKQASDDIYLMKHLDCPAVIAECGFLSNVQEAQMLKQDSYQKRLAICMICGYLQYLELE
ncbi:MAG: N-acetylmuramoyl-L-alanine amidase [Eubacteriales bacterium]|nr:N-acetylmuramoyl-L-alanine amidase [Eubacteriales bacterium]